MQNLGYDDNIVIASKKNVQQIHLMGVGKFCKCGCGKRIEQYKLWTRKLRNGKILSTVRKMDRKIYATKYCEKRDKPNRNHKSKNTISGVSIDLRSIEGKRKVKIYLKGVSAIETFIDKRCGQLWIVLDKLQKYSTMPNEKILLEKEILVCQ